MNRLLPGLRKFSERIFPKQQGLFQSLAQAQKPHTLMITCADSRVDPAMVTQTKPGEMFIMRNAGNIVPPYGSSCGGEDAAIEFAIEILGVSNIVVCGHTQCGAMTALLNPEHLNNLPALKNWLFYAQDTMKRMHKHGMEETLSCAVEQNVLVQAEHLKTHPTVAEALRQGRVQIFAWIYNLELGSIMVYDPVMKKYIPSTELKGEVETEVSRFAL